MRGRRPAPSSASTWLRLSPRLHPQTRLASRPLQPQARARQAAQLLGSRTGRALHWSVQECPPRLAARPGAWRPGPGKVAGTSIPGATGQAPSCRSDASTQEAAKRIPGLSGPAARSGKGPASSERERPASLRWPAALHRVESETVDKARTRTSEAQTISSKCSLCRSLSPRGGVQTEVVGKIQDLGPGLKC